MMETNELMMRKACTLRTQHQAEGRGIQNVNKYNSAQEQGGRAFKCHAEGAGINLYILTVSRTIF